MDFFQFLQNSTHDANENKRKSRVKTKGNVSEPAPLYISKQNQNITSDHQDERVTLYTTIKRGDLVKIINVPNSILNSYKGYIGEIRDYKPGKSTALVFLHAISHQNTVKFPIEHFITFDPYSHLQN